jgi:hypothetical protein
VGTFNGAGDLGKTCCAIILLGCPALQDELKDLDESLDEPEELDEPDLDDDEPDELDDQEIADEDKEVWSDEEDLGICCENGTV